MVGLLFGSAFWCRPTAVVPAALVFGLLLLNARYEALRFLVVCGFGAAVLAALAAAAAFSIGVHTVQGFYNPATWTWTDRPNVYQDPVEKLFDVTNPQFLATRSRNHAAAVRYKREHRRIGAK